MNVMHLAVNVASLYAAPSRDSERVSQALFGQPVTVQDTRDGFSQVTAEDRYTGWVQTEMLAVPWGDADHFRTGIATLFADVHSRPDGDSPLLTKLTVGARVALARRPEVGDWVPLLLPQDVTGYVHKVSLNMTHDGAIPGPDLLDQKARRILSIHDLKAHVLAAVGENAARVGRRFVGTPYLWGGCSSFGLDCSGLTQLAYRLSGILLLRDADLQFHDKRFMRVEDGLPLGEADLQTGDLVVFGAGEKATHIGLALGDGSFLHASASLSGVYVTSCDDPHYQPLYRGTVRVSPDADLAVEAA